MFTSWSYFSRKRATKKCIQKALKDAKDRKCVISWPIHQIKLKPMLKTATAFHVCAIIPIDPLFISQKICDTDKETSYIGTVFAAVIERSVCFLPAGNRDKEVQSEIA